VFLDKVGEKYYFVNFMYANKRGKRTKENRILTICTVIEETEEDRKPYVGIAKCSELEPVFDKRVGRKVAFTKALQFIDDKVIRTRLWEAYFKRISI
jgi:hypothetical protein